MCLLCFASLVFYVNGYKYMSYTQSRLLIFEKSKVYSFFDTLMRTKLLFAIVYKRTPV